MGLRLLLSQDPHSCPGNLTSPGLTCPDHLLSPHLASLPSAPPPSLTFSHLVHPPGFFPLHFPSPASPYLTLPTPSVSPFRHLFLLNFPDLLPLTSPCLALPPLTFVSYLLTHSVIIFLSFLSFYLTSLFHLLTLSTPIAFLSYPFTYALIIPSFLSTFLSLPILSSHSPQLLYPRSIVPLSFHASFSPFLASFHFIHSPHQVYLISSSYSFIQALILPILPLSLFPG